MCLRWDRIKGNGRRFLCVSGVSWVVMMSERTCFCYFAGSFPSDWTIVSRPQKQAVAHIGCLARALKAGNPRSRACVVLGNVGPVLNLQLQVRYLESATNTLLRKKTSVFLPLSWLASKKRYAGLSGKRKGVRARRVRLLRRTAGRAHRLHRSTLTPSGCRLHDTERARLRGRKQRERFCLSKGLCQAR